VDLENVKRRTNTGNLFMIHTGAHLESVSEGHSEVVLTLTDIHTNLYGAVHGGVLLTLVDSACGAACRTYGGSYVTVECKTNFIRGIKAEGQTIRAVGDVIHNGRTIKVCEVRIYDGDVLTCLATATMYAVSQGTDTPAQKTDTPE